MQISLTNLLLLLVLLILYLA